MRLKSCFGSPNKRVHIIQEARTISFKERLRKCCGSYFRRHCVRIIAGSVLMAIGVTLCVCYLFHTVVTGETAQLFWFCAAISGACSFTLGLLCLTFFPLIRFTRTQLALSSDQRLTRSEQSPPGTLRAVNRLLPGCTSPEHCMISQIHGTRRCASENHAFPERMPQFMSTEFTNCPEGVSYEDNYVVTGNGTPMKNKPYPQQSIDLATQEIFGEDTVQSGRDGIIRRTYLIRSLSMNSRPVNNPPQNAFGVRGNPIAEARLVSTRPLLFLASKEDLNHRRETTRSVDHMSVSTITKRNSESQQ